MPMTAVAAFLLSGGRVALGSVNLPTEDSPTEWGTMGPEGFGVCLAVITEVSQGVGPQITHRGNPVARFDELFVLARREGFHHPNLVIFVHADEHANYEVNDWLAAVGEA